jgi:DNA-binding transcriptional MerR regulator
MSSRTYLSIGDVLTLLREEFPDVTISKIRFLESQGLVNPERSPSGYRKFFEADVERLRWVLRQQREHFLPLKVIRDRLADGDLGEDSSASVVAASGSSVGPVNGKAAARTHAGAGAGLSGRGRTVGLGSTTTAARTEEQSTQADDEAMARILADASRRVARVPEGSREHMLVPAVPDPGAPSSAGATDVLGVPRERDALRAVDTEGLRPDPDAPHSQGAAATTGGASPVSPTPTEGAADEHIAARAPIASPAGPLSSQLTSSPTSAATATPTPRAASSATPNGLGGADAGVAAAAGTAGVGAGTAGVGARGTGAEGGAAPVHGTRGASGRAGGGEVPTVSAEARAAGARGDAGRPGGSEKRPVGTAGTAGAAGAAGAAGRASGPAGERGGAVTGAASGPTSGLVTGASLTSEELCAASGLSEIELASLQGFGLIEPVMVAGIPTFDEDALTVANLAAEFRKYGIEARHLRLYRNAVDREMGLIEQVIIPLLRQRNPESRQRAVDAADELGALGQTMRATLLRTALQRHVGG